MPLFLIAHKVRGQPAFDIAEPIQIGDEEGWIIPTSGHRAYPYGTPIPITVNGSVLEIEGESIFIGSMPADLEDHYPIVRAPDAPKPDGKSLLAALGLGRAAPLTDRRF